MAEAADNGRRRLRPPRPAASWAMAGGAVLVAWGLARAGLPIWGAAVAGTTAMACGFAVAVRLIRALLARSSGAAGVAGTVVDEAIRMRSTLVLLVVFMGLVPALPLLIDPTERLAYRVQFLIGWTLGSAGLILSLMTVFLACGSVCGDIESGRIHMTLVKPLHRWEYLVGKWLGIALFDLVLVSLAGVGAYTLVRMLAVSPAADAADRETLETQVLVARRGVPPGPDQPEDYAAAVAAAIKQLEADDPAAMGTHPEAVRRRIRHEYECQWHTVTPDMETTFVFPGVGAAVKRGASAQLQLEPRVTNVDFDLADVRFALWLNGRPWPLRSGVQSDLTLPSRVRHVFDLPADLAGEADDLSVRIANRNLIPPGETRPTAITFPPGEGMKLLIHTGSFEANFVRCLVIVWAKLVLLAAVGVAAGAMFDLPSAILATLVVYVTALGSDFFRDALGTYNVVADTVWERALQRMAFATDHLLNLRFYGALRMLLGFITDGLLWVLPSFSADASVSRLATGISIPLNDVASRLVLFGGLYPLLFGMIGWLVFRRRDLVRSSS